MKIRIKENSLIARIASFNLGTSNVAIVIGKTIYLYNATRQELLQNKRWLCHEVRHVQQWQEQGYVKFVINYLWYSIRFGYAANPHELDAESHAHDVTILNGIEFI